MSMSPLLFRRSLHGRAGLVLSSTEPVVVSPGAIGDFFRSETMPSSPSLQAWWKTGRAVVFAGRALAKFRGEGREGLAIQNGPRRLRPIKGLQWQTLVRGDIGRQRLFRPLANPGEVEASCVFRALMRYEVKQQRALRRRS
jgi:hypothetical protein